MSRRLAASLALVLAAPLATAVPTSASAPTSRAAAPPVGPWVAAWQGASTAGNTARQPGCPSDRGLRDQTVRNVVTTSVSGRFVRIRLSNVFGTRPLRVTRASVALAVGDGPAVRPGTRRTLRFGDATSVRLAAGSEVLSAPVRLDVRAREELAVSVAVHGASGPATQHNGASQSSWLAGGHAAGAAAGVRFGRRITCWLFVNRVDVRPDRRVRGTVVTLGDSITDGFGSTVGRDRRYPDALARRLRAVAGPTLAVSNAGISGNTLLRPVEGIPAFGRPARWRLTRDVVGQPGACAVIVLIGTNDIGTNQESARDIIAGHRQVAERLSRTNLVSVVGTLPPFGGAAETVGGDYGTPRGERRRRAVNAWIRSQSAYDAVVDFARVLRDPDRPRRLLPRYDVGDHLHPNDAGYAAMADAVNLRQLSSGPFCLEP